MNKYFFLFFTIFIVISCKETESDKITVNWKEYKDDSIKLKIPRNCEIGKQKDVWRYFPYDDDNPKLYFSIQKYDVSKIGMDDKEYLKVGFQQISDKIDKFRYTLKRLKFNNAKTCYILTVFTKEQGIDYATYSLIYKPEHLIYDFAFKTISDEKLDEHNYREFLLIVQSFELNGAKIMNSSELKIDEEKKITFKQI